MAIRPDYQTGTIDLVASSADFTTTGAALQMVAVQPGDAIITPSGHVLIIASITGQNSGTLFLPCPPAAAGTGLALRVRFQPDGSRYQGAVRNLIERLSNGVLDSIASIPVEDGNLIIGNAAGQYEPISADAFLSRLRIKLTANAVISVSPTGDDVSGSMSSPFKTINGALSYVYNGLDLGGFGVTINVADGTYSENIVINGKPLGAGSETDQHPLTIIGNVTSPSAVKIGASTGTVIKVINGGKVAVGGFRYASSGYANNVFGTGSMLAVIGKVEFETMTGDHFISSAFSAIEISADYTILGGALNHIHATEGGSIAYTGTRSITVSGNPAFTGQFAGCAFGVIKAINVTYTGAATGKRFLCHLNGEIRTQTNNRNIFPGSASGELLTGGRFDNTPYAHITRSGADVTLTPGVATAVNWNSSVSAVNGMWSSGAKINPISGMFVLEVRIRFINVPADNRLFLNVYKNGTSYRVISAACTSSSTIYDLELILPNEVCNGSDVYDIYVQANGTAGAQYYGLPQFTYFTARQI